MYKPMLATQYDEGLLKAHFRTGPVLASPKLDGIRCVIHKHCAVARSLKPIPNAHIQSVIGKPQYEHYDGELIVGQPNSTTVYRDSFSGVMSKDGEPNFTFWVFDHTEIPTDGYVTRIRSIRNDTHVKLLPQKMITSFEDLLAFEAQMLEQGFEGAMIRKPNAPYKFGRSTAKELYLCKVKREQDDEADILEIYEAMENQNEAFINELGHIDRSSHQENLVGKGMAGGFVLRRKDGIIFRCSAGKFSHDERKAIWERRAEIAGRYQLKYRSFGYGVKDAPRFPRAIEAIGFRHLIDT